MEKQDLEGKLREANMKRSAIETELQEASERRSELEARAVHWKAELQEAQLQTLRLVAPASESAQKSAGDGYPVSERLSKEIERIEVMLTTTMKLLDNPDIELSMVMRKSNEYKELQSYLRGIRFAIDTDSPGE